VSVGRGVLVEMGVLVGIGVWVGVLDGLGEGEGISVIVAVAVGVKVGLGVRVGVEVTLACCWGLSWASEQATRAKLKRIAPTATRRLFILSPWKCPCRDWVMEHCINAHYNQDMLFWQERERLLEGRRGTTNDERRTTNDEGRRSTTVNDGRGTGVALMYRYLFLPPGFFRGNNHRRFGDRFGSLAMHW
jgi:hypothetical protein